MSGDVSALLVELNLTRMQKGKCTLTTLKHPASPFRHGRIPSCPLNPKNSLHVTQKQCQMGISVQIFREVHLKLQGQVSGEDVPVEVCVLLTETIQIWIHNLFSEISFCRPFRATRDETEARGIKSMA